MKGINLKRKDRVVFQIVQIGAGANGSHFFRSLLQDAATYRHQNKFAIQLTLCDADRVESKNLNNQLFTKDDVGEAKVTALADRYGVHYGYDIKTVSEFITDMEKLTRLFTPIEVNKDIQLIPVLIGMVDNNASRQLMDQFFYSDEVKDLVYIDVGVEGVSILEKPEREWSEEDRETIYTSGFGGQIVVGVKVAGEVLLEPVGRVYKNIRTDTASPFPGQSCGAAIVNNPQRCATNKLAAQLANGVMNNLFHTGNVYTHVINFSALSGGSRPTFVSDDVIEKAKKLLKTMC